uniref:Recombination signal binding protein for immunoglobulin kappa J region like n=1 Tax=Fundulus heteroclitus TaxID=8078 RepID=A0A3Q2R4G2_FUNHE
MPGGNFLGAGRESKREAHADQSITILHAKVAQKSYGSEKRFFCPPPCVYISGHGWRVMMSNIQPEFCQKAIFHFLIFFILSLFVQQLFACAKSLFISDQDKRKHFCLLLRLFLGNQQEVGSFQSRMIKVISKPSQKRQSMKNADLCISSCSKVALFNRLRSQTVSTRYLSVDSGAFIASARQWTAFTITMVDDQRSDQGGLVLSEGFICYGSVVQLVCTESGVALPPMVIRKVNKQHAILDVDEPVSQLHKCAFQFRDNPNAYLCLSNDTIIQYQAPSSIRDSSKVVLNDGSCWTIIGVEVVEFTFNRGLASIQTPVSPFPVITGLGVSLSRNDFSPLCFFHYSPFRSPKSMLCVIPDVSVYSDSWRCLRRIITLPLSLVRSDGLIYRTSYSFTYSPELHLPPSARGATAGREGGADRGQEDEEDILIQSSQTNFLNVGLVSLVVKVI